eukprot:scaffold64100_cov54-Phaeocystis_antarctica.AAC.1
MHEKSVSQDQKIGCRDQRWGGRAGRIKEGKFRAGGSVGFRPRPPRSSRRDPGAGGSRSARPGLTFVRINVLKTGFAGSSSRKPLKTAQRHLPKSSDARIGPPQRINSRGSPARLRTSLSCTCT